MSITFNAERAIAECAGAVLAGLDETSAALGAQLRRALPELVADEDMAREFMASIRGNVAAGLSVIGAQEPVGDVRVPDEVLGYARMLVHRSVPMERLLHSYRIGQAQFWRLWLDALAERVDDRDLFIAALRLSSDRLDSYVDRVVSLLVAESEHEQERWLRRAVGRRTELVQRLLAASTS